MKKRIIALFFVVLSLTIILASCGNKGDIPDGMKRASDTRIVDYELFVPETWIVDTPSFSSSEDDVKMLAVSMAHVSTSDRSNISVAQWNVTVNTSNIDTWWENEYKPDITNVLGATVSKEGEEMVLDGKTAKKYEYSAKVNETTYKFMVVSTVRNGSIYVITYTSNEENYDKNLDDVSKILENIRFK